MNKTFGIFVMFSLTLLSFYLARPPPHISLPSPIKIYHTPNLTQIYHQEINQAKKSIDLNVYHLKCAKMIKGLCNKASAVSINIAHDQSNPIPNVSKLKGRVKIAAKKIKGGIMHKKILVIDRLRTYIGSANMTKESLRSHGNIVVGIEDKTFAKTMLSNEQSNCNFNIGNQKVEMWSLPEAAKVQDRIVELIRSANESIKVAMFSFTRLDFANELISAKENGRHVEVALDRNAALGVGKTVYALLKEHGIQVALSKDNSLLHYKMMLIDNHTLVQGSANWTKKAFTKNEECIMVLHNLNQEEKDDLECVFNRIQEMVTLQTAP